MQNTLHILSLSRRAGLEMMFLNFLCHMKKYEPMKLKNQVIVLSDISPYFKKQLEQLGVKYYVLDEKGITKVGKLFNRILKIKGIISQYNIRVVYGQNFGGNFYASLAVIGMKKIKLICHEHGTAWTNNYKKALLTRIWVKKANLIICNSRAAKNILSKRFNGNEKKIKVIYNGVPYQQLKRINKDKKYILFVGRLDYIKSPETFLKSIPFILDEIADIKVDFLGDGDMIRFLRSFIVENQLDSIVTLRGNVLNISEYMARASLLVVPSIREAFGNVIVEAALQNTPTIGTHVDGIPEVIKQNETGVLIKPTISVRKKGAPTFVVNPESGSLMKPKEIDPKELALEITNLMKSDRIGRMGSKAREHVKEKFSFVHYYDSIMKELEMNVSPN